MKLSSILGLNSRSAIFGNNSARSKRIARSKILTKRILRRAGVPTPKLYKVFRTDRDISNFDWGKISSSFALKPSKSSYGDGIIIVRKRVDVENKLTPSYWVTSQRKKIYKEDLDLHVLDILEGAYSVGNVPDIAFCEEYIARHKVFRRFAYRGTPDIRVLVFNSVPVMSMLRLPTVESGGRANLHKGAIGVGIDIETGVTTYAIHHGERIEYKPGNSKVKFSGIKIPSWSQILEVAVSGAAAAGLDLCGVDVVLHSERGPQVLELNSQPGLQIQLANMAGLRKRLERVEDLRVLDAEHGVRIAKALFSSHAKRKSEDTHVLGIAEKIKIRTANGAKRVVEAKVDTGAHRSAIDKKLARELGLLKARNILWKRKVRSTFGEEERPVISLVFWLRGKKIVTQAGVADRKNMKKRVIIGRRDLGGFLVELGRKK
ncbi:MAG: sugar-transfer associated ATP-grasp domain-containing protein [Patescibacteria group bacterium]